MNIALIFAGGTGIRMNSKAKPKQFLELRGKSILMHTIENFEFHNQIDAIAVVCLKDWMDEFRREVERYGIKKIRWIIPGGKTTQESVYNGLQAIAADIDIKEDTIVLVHDGVRPFIERELITKNIESVNSFGSAVSAAHEWETAAIVQDDGIIENVMERRKVRVAKAPQSFYFRNLMEAHEKAISEDKASFIDSTALMMHYGYQIHTVLCSSENIKVTTAADFYLFRALLDARDNSQIFG